MPIAKHGEELADGSQPGLESNLERLRGDLLQGDLQQHVEVVGLGELSSGVNHRIDHDALTTLRRRHQESLLRAGDVLDRDLPTVLVH